MTLLIFGGGGQLGRALARAAPGATALAHAACDVTDPDSCRAAVEEAARSLGGIDGLVYSSGIGRLEKMADIEE